MRHIDPANAYVYVLFFSDGKTEIYSATSKEEAIGYASNSLGLSQHQNIGDTSCIVRTVTSYAVIKAEDMAFNT